MATNPQLDSRDIRILIALQTNPLATYQVLAEETGYSKSLVYKTLKRLEEFSTTQKLYQIKALPKLNTLGLIVVEIFFKCKTIESVRLLERMCYEHPYTIFRARCFGQINGLFCQFRIPIGTYNLIHNFCEILVTHRIAESFQLLHFDGTILYTTVKLSCWDITGLRWNFDWHQWFKQLFQIELLPNELIHIKEPVVSKEIKPPAWLTPKDIAILGELCRNSRRKEVDIMDLLKASKNIDFSPQTFSRRMRKIKETCIEYFRLDFDPKAFDIFQPFIVHVRANPKFIIKLRKYLTKNPIPFISLFKNSTTEFFWFLQLPPTHMFALIEFLLPISENMDYYVLDRTQSANYVPWWKSFDDSTKTWNKSEKFMVTDVINELLDYQEKNKDVLNKKFS